MLITTVSQAGIETEYDHQAVLRRHWSLGRRQALSFRLTLSATERGIRAGVLECQAHGKDIQPTKRPDMKRGLTTLPFESGFFEKYSVAYHQM